MEQNTTNLDFSRNFKSVLNGLNFAFGGEYRVEKYEITAGEVGSYATYDTNGVPITYPLTQSAPIDPISGNPRPGGSQGFPGFSPANEVNEDRNSVAAYVDAELDVSDEFLLGTALRYENYSDFGNTLNSLTLSFKTILITPAIASDPYCAAAPSRRISIRLMALAGIAFKSVPWF